MKGEASGSLGKRSPTGGEGRRRAPKSLISLNPGGRPGMCECVLGKMLCVAALGGGSGSKLDLTKVQIGRNWGRLPKPHPMDEKVTWHGILV